MSIRVEDLHKMDFSDVTARGQRLAPTRPGDILLHDFMQPLGLSANALAGLLGVPTNRITGIINGTRSVTADSALRLGHYFGTSAELWLNLQQHYDLRLAQKQIAPALARLPVRAAA